MNSELTIPHEGPSLARGRALALWIGVLGPPGIWGLQFEINYAMVPRLCRMNAHWLMHLCSAAGLVLAAVATGFAWREFQRLRQEEPEAHGDQWAAWPRFMAVLGLMVGTMFCLLIIAQAIPGFLINPCVE
jgi:hypothetical protein